MLIRIGNAIASGFLWLGSWIDAESPAPNSSYSYDEYDNDPQDDDD